jgi:hypothetical protein
MIFWFEFLLFIFFVLIQKNEYFNSLLHFFVLIQKNEAKKNQDCACFAQKTYA